MTSAYFFPTPDSIVQSIIKAEALGDFARILEPAVGDGALLKAIGNNYKELLAFDINVENLSKVKKKIDPNKSKLSCEDFLNAEIEGKFDLILSNPPFNNNLAHHVSHNNKKASIETAFVLKCLQLLKLNGKAIFILPSSIINGDKTKWLRKYIVSTQKIISIYKLPKRSFKRVEGSFYVLCLENRPSNNYDIRFYKSCKLSYILNSSSIISQNFNLDPELLSRSSEYERILYQLGKVKLSSLSSIERGNVCATGNKQSIYHSTDFKSHVARPKSVSGQLVSSATTRHLKILLKRVGRLASKSFSIYYGKDEIPCSDCIITITPNTNSEMDSLSLLLKIRTAVLLGADAVFEISGSGASYISLSRIKSLDLPTHSIFQDSETLNNYKKMLISENIVEANEFENKIASLIIEQTIDAKIGIEN